LSNPKDRKGEMPVSTRKLITIASVVLLALRAGGNVSTASFTHDGPTVVVLESVEAIPGVRQVEVRWTTISELDTAGFNVMRSTSAGGPWEQANAYLIIALGVAPGGADYSFVDTGLTGGITYYYYIRGVTASGSPPTDDYTDYIRSATPKHGIYLPIVLGPPPTDGHTRSDERPQTRNTAWQD
jgi:hypothetical protein